MQTVLNSILRRVSQQVHDDGLSGICRAAYETSRARHRLFSCSWLAGRHHLPPRHGSPARAAKETANICCLCSKCTTALPLQGWWHSAKDQWSCRLDLLTEYPFRLQHATMSVTRPRRSRGVAAAMVGGVETCSYKRVHKHLPPCGGKRSAAARVVCDVMQMPSHGISSAAAMIESLPCS